jgi:S1-C subfamily serine protease
MIFPNIPRDSYVVGNAVGYGSSISRGVLSAVNRNITVDMSSIKFADGCAINPKSGGPVIDISGGWSALAQLMAFTPQGVPPRDWVLPSQQTCLRQRQPIQKLPRNSRR